MQTMFFSTRSVIASMRAAGKVLIDVFERGPKDLNRVSRIETMRGARTSLFVPELDRLYLAVPATSATGAMIQIYRPRL